MKQKDLKPCALCGKGMMHSGSPMFYRVRIAAEIVNMREVQAAHGLELMLGGGEQGAAMASVMGPNPDLTVALWQAEVLVCQDCALGGRRDELTRLIDKCGNASAGEQESS